jgi:pantetheine-phosphate adenylyltransferase
MALMNRDMAHDIESVFLMTSAEYIFLSSSIVKEVKQFGEDISHLVPKVVDDALTERMSK